MAKKAAYVSAIGLVVALLGLMTLKYRLVIGPFVLLLGIIPLLGLIVARRSLKGAIPDLVFGAIDTGLLTIPAIWGGLAFGVAGAIAGGVIGVALGSAFHQNMPRKNAVRRWRNNEVRWKTRGEAVPIR